MARVERARAALQDHFSLFPGRTKGCREALIASMPFRSHALAAARALFAALNLWGAVASESKDRTSARVWISEPELFRGALLRLSRRARPYDEFHFQHSE
jgi:hypothetical protein